MSSAMLSETMIHLSKVRFFKRSVFFLLIILTLFLSGSTGAEEKETVSLKDFQREVLREFDTHNYSKVVHLYEDYSEKNPNDYLPITVQMAYSQALANTGELEESAKVLQFLLNSTPAELVPLKLEYDLANLLFLQRRYDEATKVYHRVLLHSQNVSEIVSKSKERLLQMRQKDSKKNDYLSIQLLDLETILESGEIPTNADSLIKKALKDKLPPKTREWVDSLSQKITTIRTERAALMLNEARRLFDEGHYAEAASLTDQLSKEYRSFVDQPSLETLQKAVSNKVK